MNVIPAKSFSENAQCPICFEAFNDSINPGMVHEGEGEKHNPIHLKCWRTWVQTKMNCPICRTDIDESSLFPLCEKVTKWFVNATVVSAATLGAYTIASLIEGQKHWGTFFSIPITNFTAVFARSSKLSTIPLIREAPVLIGSYLMCESIVENSYFSAAVYSAATFGWAVSALSQRCSLIDEEAFYAGMVNAAVMSIPSHLLGGHLVLFPSITVGALIAGNMAAGLIKRIK